MGHRLIENRQGLIVDVRTTHATGRRSDDCGSHASTTGDARQLTVARPGMRVTRSASSLRKRIEEPLGWIKTAAGLRKTRHWGLARVGWVVTLTAAACNLVRLPKLLANAV